MRRSLSWDVTQRILVVNGFSRQQIGSIVRGQAVQTECQEHFGTQSVLGTVQVAASATSWSPFQRSPTGCVCVCV
jgi:hypothetical protein